MTLLLAAPPAAPSGGNLAAYVALAVSVLGPVIAGLNAWSSRKTRRERESTSTKTESEAAAVASGSVLEWRKTDHQALLDERAYSEKTRNELITAQQKIRDLADQSAEQDRKLDGVLEELRQIRVSINACPGGPPCPLKPVGLTEPTTAPPPEG